MLFIPAFNGIYLSNMNTKQRLLLYGITLFLMIWGLDVFSSLKSDVPVKWSEALTVFHLSQVIYVICALLLTHWAGVRFFSRRRYGAFVISLVGIIIIFVTLRFLIEQVIYGRFFNIWNYPRNVRFDYYFLDNTYYALLYMTLGFLLYLLDAQIGNQKKQALLIQQSREAELQFLRMQINPHFLFNTLNNIYSLVYEQSAKAPEAVLQLSNLLRYMLYEKKELVPIEKEWNYIDDFITLQQLRFDYPVRVLQDTQLTAEGKQIPPYLLIPFIENAFKHGDFRQEPLRLSLVVTDTELLFESSNRIQHAHKDETGGIGLANIKRRLELLYPSRHTLKIEETNDWFRVHLRIKF